MDQEYDLSIIQMNDLHGYLEPHWEYLRKDGEDYYEKLGGLSRIAGYIKRARENSPGSVVVLDNGDTIHGTYPVVKTKGKLMIPILNGIVFDAWTAHWDFAYGPGYLIDFSKKLDYPLLAINCYHEDSDEPVFDPYRMVSRNGMNIGIIGIANRIVDRTMPDHFSEGIYLTLGKEELPDYIKELKGEGADLILVLAHLGYPQEVKLAREVEGIDVLVSGHTHNRLYRPSVVDGTIVIQSGCHGSFLGRLDLGLDDSGISDFNHELIKMDHLVKKDRIIDDMVEKSMKPYRKKLGKVVGRTKIGLLRDNVLETTMDNLLLESLMDSAGSEMAFSNGWRYGTPVPPGEVTMEALWNMIPVDPPVSTCDIKGSELWKMMEENLERTFSGDPYEQMGGYVKRCSGINVYFKVENPGGLRIQEFFVGDDRLDPNRYYSASFVTSQGIPSKYGINRRDLGYSAIEVLRKYVEKNTPVDPGIKNSIVPI